MNKLLLEISRILKELAIDISNGIPANNALGRVAGLADAVDKWAVSMEPTLQEKIDFLIFMQAKRIPQGKKEIIVSGEELFKEWQAAKAKMTIGQKSREKKSNLKPIPNESNDGKN